MAFQLKDFLTRFRRQPEEPTVTFPELPDLQAVAAERGWAYAELYPETIQICPGAKALGEDFLQWVENGHHLLRTHRDAGRGLDFSRQWACYLHSVRRYKMDKVFRCALPEAAVISRGGGVLTDRNELATEGYFITRPLRASQFPGHSPKAREGKFISLLTIWGEKNLGHFFFDAMLRTTLFEHLEDFRFLVPADLQPWHCGLFEVMGIQDHQLVLATEPYTRLEELHVCHTSSEGSMPRGELLKRFRERALAHIGVSPAARGRRRLFVDRSGAKRRKLVNQKEIEPVLRDRGFELVMWETLSMAEQVRVASEAECIAGPHGTSLLNSIYCHPGAKLLEIVNPYWWDAATLRQCVLLGHEFWYCFGDSVSADHDTRVDPRKLAKVLDYMLDGPQFDTQLG